MVRLRRLVATGTIAALIAALWLASPVMWQSVAHANSADATLSVLLVKNETHLWVIAPPDTTWDVDVPNSVSTLTVDALPSNSQASYVVRFDGVTAPDGNVSLSVGSNIITVEVTAEGGVGISELGYAIVERVWERMRDIIASCPCVESCPRCVDSPTRFSQDAEPNTRARLNVGALTPTLRYSLPQLGSRRLWR